MLGALPAFGAELGLDKPAHVSKRKIGVTHDVTPPAPIEEVCLSFGDGAVLWKEDPALKGVDQIVFRRGKSACRSKGGTKIESFGGPIGRAGRYFLVEDEGLGDSMPFGVLDLETGKTALSSTRDASTDVRFEKRGAAMAVMFRYVLDLARVPIDAASWQAVERANKIALDLPLPDCAAAFKEAPMARTEPRAIMISVNAEIADLATPTLTFKAGAPRCELLP